MSYSVKSFTATETQAMFDSSDAKRDELIAYQKCVLGNNPGRLDALTKFYCVDGSKLDPECCVPVPKYLKDAIMKEVVQKILVGMKVNGKPGNWSCGELGSRWFDIDADKYGVDYIRVAFYSKKGDAKWDEDKPYLIVVTVEKGR